MGVEVLAAKKAVGKKYECTGKALIVRDAVLMSQGIWNDVYYDKSEIAKAFEVTDWANRDKVNLFLDHQDQKASEWIGDVQGMRFENDTLYGDLYVYDPGWMDKLNNGKPKVGISPKVKGDVDEKDNTMHNFTFENFSLVINPAVKTAYINNMETLKVEEEVGLSEQEEQEIIKSELEEALKEEKIEEAKSMEDNFENYADLLELFELKKLSVSKVLKKAKELRQKDESLRDALRRAAALLQEEGEKEEEKVEEEKPVEPTPPAEPAEPVEEVKDEEIKALSKKVEELTAKLNEPEVKILKKVESKLEEGLDKGMLAYLQEIDKESLGGR